MYVFLIFLLEAGNLLGCQSLGIMVMLVVDGSAGHGGQGEKTD